MPGGSMSVSAVSDESVRYYRIFFFLGWTAIIGVVPWFLATASGTPVLVQMNGWVPVLIILSVLSTPIGWYFGYRHLWWPLFFSKITVNKGSRAE